MRALQQNSPTLRSNRTIGELSLSSHIRFGDPLRENNHDAEFGYIDSQGAGAGRILLAFGHIVRDGKIQRFRELGEQTAQQLLSLPVTEIGNWLATAQNGRFNVVVHDLQLQKTFVWNDRGGFLPLYLSLDRSGLVLASDYHILRQLRGGSLSLDSVGLAELYRFGYPIGNRTAYSNVALAAPGSELVIDWKTQAQTTSSVYARHTHRATSTLSVEQCAEEVHSLIDTACARTYSDESLYALKLSGGMDSRLIASAMGSRPVRSYTWGDHHSKEMDYAARMAASCGFEHRELPVETDFYNSYHSMHQSHGLMEFFHEFAAERMISDGCTYNLDGMLGDIFFGGLGLNRINSGDRARAALGIPPVDIPVPDDLNLVVDKIVQDIAVPSNRFAVLNGDVVEELKQQQSAIREDILAEISPCSDQHDSLDGLVLQFKLYNRSRRYIALQNATSRDACETVFPFLDSDLWAFAEQIPFSVTANKRLYIALYSRYYPEHRAVPAIMSGLNFFSRPEHVHYLGRIGRVLSEKVGSTLAKRGMERMRPRTHEATQWSRWLNSNDMFRDWISAQLEQSPWIDSKQLDQVLTQAHQGQAKVNGTNLMLTLSLCAWLGYRS